MKDSQIKAQLQTLRKGERVGQVVAHLNDAGIPTAVPGDDQAPYTKANPFVTEIAAYLDEAQLPDSATTYLIGPTIDVAAWRVLNVYLNFTGSAEDSALSLIPEGAGAIDDTDAPFRPIGVIDPTLTPATIDTDGSFGSRTMYQTELRSPATGAFRTALAFDVTAYEAFRFQAAEIGAGEDEPGTLRITYALSM